MKKLPRELILLIIRHGLSALGVLLMSQGFLTDEDSRLFVQGAGEILGGILTIAGLAWSAQRKVARAPRAEIARQPHHTPARPGNPRRRRLP